MLKMEKVKKFMSSLENSGYAGCMGNGDWEHCTVNAKCQLGNNVEMRIFSKIFTSSLVFYCTLFCGMNSITQLLNSLRSLLHFDLFMETWFS